MRTVLMVVAVLLLAAGGAISAGMLGYDRTETVAKLGPIEVTNTERKQPAPLLGYGLLGAGVVVLLVGLSRKK